MRCGGGATGHGLFGWPVNAFILLVFLTGVLGVLAPKASAPLGIEVHAVVNSYSSGTNGGATAEATATANGISIVAISVGPFSCFSMFSCSAAYLSYNQGIGFASNYFADGDEVPVSAWATGCPSGTLSDETATTIYNKGKSLAMTDPDFLTVGVNLATFVRNELIQLKHSVNPAGTFFEHKASIKDRLPTDTVFYMFTHGWNSPLLFWDSYTDLDHYLVPGEVQTEIARKNDVLPPLPQYNFVNVHSCYSAMSDGFAVAFGVYSPSAMKYDRAYVGWVGLCNALADQFDYALWTRLVAGDELSQAFNTALLWAPPGQIPKYYGDATLKLYGVYHGSEMHRCYGGVP